VLNPSGVVPIHDSYIAPWSWYPLILIVHVVDRHWNSSKSVWPCPSYGNKHWILGFWNVLNSTRVVPSHDSYIALCSMVPSYPPVHIVDIHWNCSKSIQPCLFYGSKHSIRGFGSVLNSTRVVPTHDSYIASWSMVPSYPPVHIVDRHWNCSKSVQACAFYGDKHWILGFRSVLNPSEVVPIHESDIASWSMVPPFLESI